MEMILINKTGKQIKTIKSLGRTSAQHNNLRVIRETTDVSNFIARWAFYNSQY